MNFFQLSRLPSTQYTNKKKCHLLFRESLLNKIFGAYPKVCGAPDPTAGASASEQTSWCLDENTLHENIRKILIKFCVPSPTVFR
jgi:hypothetical protein